MSLDSRRPEEVEREKLVAELTAALTCPVVWENFLSNHALIDRLYVTWLWCVMNYPYQIRSEGALVNEPTIPSKDLVELKSDLLNLQSWIEHARYSYLQMVTPVHRIQFVEYRDKHWPPGGWTRAQVIERSIDKVKGSYFFHDFKSDLLHGMIQLIIAERFEDFLLKTNRFYYIGWVTEVGASKQAATRLICFDIDYSTPSYHAFPVAPDEVEQSCFIGFVREHNVPYKNPPKAGDFYLSEE